MNELIQKINQCVDDEITSSIRTHGTFNSNHEAYAVLLEEVDETKDEYINLQIEMDKIWEAVKADKCPRDNLAKAREHALNTACEAVQVAAMCQKWIDYPRHKPRCHDCENKGYSICEKCDGTGLHFMDKNWR